MAIEAKYKRCGKEFIKRTQNHIYCCKKCRKESLYQKTDYKIICIVCNKEFITSRLNKKICSKSCKKNRLIELKKIYDKEQCRHEIVCVACGNKFTSYNHNKKFCSDRCRRRKNIVVNLKTIPDIDQRTKEIRLKFGDRLLSSWLLPGFHKKLKNVILERDSYRCYICGKETNLHVHYIIPRSLGGPHIPENLITLCSGCHKNIESGDVEKAVTKCVKRTLDNI